MAKRNNPGCGCCGSTCNSFLDGTQPSVLHWTDPVLGSFDLTNMGEDPGKSGWCYWLWCGTVDFAATTICPAASGTNFAISMRYDSTNYLLGYHFPFTTSTCVGATFFPTYDCPGGTVADWCVGTTWVPYYYFTGNIFQFHQGLHATRPYSRTFTYTMDNTDGSATGAAYYNYLKGLRCTPSDNAGSKSWVLSE